MSDAASRQHVLRHIMRERQAGYSPVVVVSAMGRQGDPYATDSLLSLIRQSGGELSKRDLDLYLSCGEMISAAVLSSELSAVGLPVAMLTGGQAGIFTNSDYGNARIAYVRPERVISLLEQGVVTVVAGFQGCTETGEVTTLGRGGSDTSAAALGAALSAERIDIYTDVDGVLTADPRIVKQARQLPVVSYDEVSNMAHNGAKVIHPRAVEIAARAGVPIRVRSTFSDGEGTMVTTGKAAGERALGTERMVAGLAYFPAVTQLSVASEDSASDLQLRVFREMAVNGINVDLISVMPSSIHYTVNNEDADRAVRLLQDAGFEPIIRSNCAKISVIGGGMNDEPGVMARIVEALTSRQITILQSADSNTTIWVLVPGERMAEALEVLHDAFALQAANS